ncbi:MAG: OmpA family protein [Bacteroidetes bacterium]|nr:OmpA family protein [Bacteroidota bacterium]
MKIKYLPLLLIIGVWQPVSAQSVSVYFGFNKYEITPQTRAVLDSLTDSLDLTERIELHGHCDAVGSSGYNDKLSLQRVNAVIGYLMKNGWDKNDIAIAKGHGENQPAQSNLTPESRNMNRRVEIKILHENKTPRIMHPKTIAEAPKVNPQKNTGVPGTGSGNGAGTGPGGGVGTGPGGGLGNGNGSGNGPSNANLRKQINDTASKAGTNIVLKNLNFEGGRHYFLPESLPILEELLQVMKENPKLVIRVEGHVCCLDNSEDGMDIDLNQNNLSVTRAKAVRDYLIQNGISTSRVSYTGLAHTQPIYPYPEKTEEEQTANRRVEIRIIKK